VLAAALERAAAREREQAAAQAVERVAAPAVERVAAPALAAGEPERVAEAAGSIAPRPSLARKFPTTSRFANPGRSGTGGITGVWSGAATFCQTLR